MWWQPHVIIQAHQDGQEKQIALHQSLFYIYNKLEDTLQKKTNSRTTSMGELVNASLRRKVNRMIDKKGGWLNHPRPVSWLWARTGTIPEPPCRSRPRVAADALAPLRPVHRPAAARAGLAVSTVALSPHGGPPPSSRLVEATCNRR